MKKLNFLITALFLLSSNLSIFGQDLTQLFINEKWKTTAGSPENIDWSASIVDAQKNLYITGNKNVITEETNLTLIKYNSAGTLLWEVDFNNPTDGNDYGTALCFDNSGNIIVVGTSFDDVSSDYDYTILKYTSGGSLSWSQLFNGSSGLNDVATSVDVDSQNNIYVTGGSEASTSLVDYSTVKYNSSGTFQWESRYNYSNYYDAAVSIIVNGSTLIVTGASASDWDQWQIATLRYDLNGNQTAERRESSSDGLDEPYGMTNDDNGNIYIVGKVLHSTEGFNSKIIKLDDNLDLVWSVDFDGEGFDDQFNSVDLDDSNNVIATGYTTKANGGKDILTVSYSFNGQENWVHQHHTVPTNLSAKGVIVRCHGDLIVVVGTLERNLGSEVIVLGYLSDGKTILIKNFEYEEDVNHQVSSLSVIDQIIYIHGIANINSLNQYFALKYTYHLKDSYYQYNGSHPSHVKNELVIQFEPSVLDFDYIDDNNFSFFDLPFAIDIGTVNCLSTLSGIDFSKQKASKIFPECHSWDSISTSRLGNEVPIPAFYSFLLVELPSSSQDSTILNNILQCSNVKSAHFNHLLTYNDCDPDDPNFLANNQSGLVPTIFNQDAHINMGDAWCYVNGNSQIKVGVMDSGINFNHEEFHNNPGSDSYVGSDVVGGYSIFTLTTSPPTPIEDSPEATYYHGSNVAGIIAARSNNGLGVSGIAGAGELDSGVEIYDIALGGSDPLNEVFWSRALYIAACDEDQTNPNPNFTEDTNACLGLDIINMSVGAPSGTGISSRMAMEFAFRNDLCIIGASGNITDFVDETENVFPASHPDDWVIKVGGSDFDGLRTSFSVYGNNMDFIAPATNDIYQSILVDDDLGYTPTTLSGNGQYQGTSFGAPHVTGIAALMMSYVNTNPDAPNNIGPEDVEHLMQYPGNYYDVFPTGYDVETGYGRPNAGSILEKIQIPCYHIYHFNGSAVANTIWTLTEEDFDLQFTTNQTVINQGNNPNGGGTVYSADRYRLTMTVNHNINSETILDSWPRNAASNLAPITATLPGEGIDLDLESINSSSATLTGYTYHFTNGTNDYWWPIGPTDLAEFHYSVYTEDLTQGSCIVSVDEYQELDFDIFPNPTQDFITIRINPALFSSTIRIFDSTGRLILSDILNHNNTQVNLGHLANGMYHCQIQKDGISINKKIILSE